MGHKGLLDGIRKMFTKNRATKAQYCRGIERVWRRRGRNEEPPERGSQDEVNSGFSVEINYGYLSTLESISDFVCLLGAIRSK